MRPDIRNQPAYTLAEAARYLKVPQATVRTWFVPRKAPRSGRVATPLILPAESPPPTLSFWNLIEAHVLRSLRTSHGVSMDALRKSISFAQDQLKIDRLLLSRELRADGGKLLLEQYGRLIDLSTSGQLVLRHEFNQHLDRVVWDDFRFPVKLFPCTSGNATPGREQPVSIAANVAFGRPVLVHGGIKTATIVGRIDAGESLVEVAEDYGITTEDVEQAVFYEKAA